MSEYPKRSSVADLDPGGSAVPRIRVFISEDHAQFRQRLKCYLERTGTMVVVGEASSGSETLDRLGEQAVDVLCLDAHMPGPRFPKLIVRVVALRPEARIVMLTMSNEQRYVTDALRAGALGYVLKESLTTELLPAIRAVHRGEVFLDSKLSRDDT